MKVSKATAAGHREALLGAASRLFREHGFEKVGIAEIAAAAGLTHGAFYTHFASKKALCAEAIAAALSRSAAGLAGAKDLDGYVSAYLSSLHVDARGEGCPLTALGGDAVRASGPIRAAFSQGVERLIASFAAAFTQDDDGADAARARAIAMIATLAGGLLLARSLESAVLRAEVLSTMKGALRALALRQPQRQASPRQRRRRGIHPRV